jgi:hypothetical protein
MAKADKDTKDTAKPVDSPQATQPEEASAGAADAAGADAPAPDAEPLTEENE